MAMDEADTIMGIGDTAGPEVTGLSHAAGDAEGEGPERPHADTVSAG